MIALCEHWFNTTLVEPAGKELRTPRVLMFPETKATRETSLLEEKYITNRFSERDLTLSVPLYIKTFTSTASIEIVQTNENSRFESVITGNY